MATSRVYKALILYFVSCSGPQQTRYIFCSYYRSRGNLDNKIKRDSEVVHDIALSLALRKLANISWAGQQRNDIRFRWKSISGVICANIALRENPIREADRFASQVIFRVRLLLQARASPDIVIDTLIEVRFQLFLNVVQPLQ